MMKRFGSVLFVLFITVSMFGQAKSFYDFKVKTLEGEDFDMVSLKGEKVMVVNTASKCGNTPQYEDLQKLYEKYGGDNFVIVGFPANNFGKQEPGTNEEIRTFCTENYGVTFPMMAKISVKGDDIHPLYLWLTSKELNGAMDSSVSWNFQKYVTDEKGNLVTFFKPVTKPTSKEIISWITGD